MSGPLLHHRSLLPSESAALLRAVAIACGALLLTAWAVGCSDGGGTTAPAPPPTPSPPGRVRLTVTCEPGVNVGRLLISVTTATGEESRWLGNNEHVDLVDGKGDLELPPGAWKLWIGTRLSPDVRMQHVVPALATVEVASGGETAVAAHLRFGAMVVVPASLGLPAASHGRIRLLCTQGGTTLERWICLRPSGVDDDVIWPPLPEGDWAVVAENDKGAKAIGRARVTRNICDTPGLPRLKPEGPR